MSGDPGRPPRRLLGWVTFWFVVVLVLLAIPALLYLRFLLTWPFGYVHM